MSTDVAQARDARHVPLSTADKLRHDAAEASEVRRLSEHPDVIALRVDKVRRGVDALVWLGIALGLAFTMVNVQTFAAAGARAWSLPWLAAWLLDPMVSLTLVAVLRAEQITARYQLTTGAWANRTKWFAFLATYLMNTWQSWAGLHVAGVVLHSVPPILVFLAAETAPALRDRLTESVRAAAGEPATPAATEVFTAPNGTPPQEDEAPVHDAARQPDHGPARDRVHQPDSATPRRRPAPAKAGRKLLADYVAEARAIWTPGVEITPAWVRSVLPQVSRGTSKNVADALRAETTGAAPVHADQPPGESGTDRSEEAA